MKNAWPFAILQALSVLLLVLVGLTIPLGAQTQASGVTSIANVQYARQAALQNGIAQATVTFNIVYNYYHYPQGCLVFAIYDTSTSNIVKGSVAASPISCQSLTGTSYAGDVICAIVPATSSGTEFATFTITFTSPQEYKLSIGSYIWSSRNLPSGTQITGSTNTSSLTITVTGQIISTNSTTTASTFSKSPSWMLARDFWYLGVFAALVLALIGAWRYVDSGRNPAPKHRKHN